MRDKIPKLLDSKGVVYKKRIATKKEYRKELIKKLEEEIKEFTEAKNIEELADILEVVEALKNLPEFKNVESIKRKKFEEKGGFSKRIILRGEK